MQVLSRISRLARHLDIARRGAFADHGLESWEFDVLSALRRQGPPFQLTPGALLRATLVTSGTMTNRIDRLAAAGLVRREPDPRDKRGVLVTLTSRGRQSVDAALADLLRRERVLLAGLNAADRRKLADLMRILLAPFDAVPLGSPPAAFGSLRFRVRRRGLASDLRRPTFRPEWNAGRRRAR
jgi:DNA-binding MarR family transcriptional regulator